MDQLVQVIAQRGAAGRSITAIAGAPGSGKSTLAGKLANRLNELDPQSAAILPMDGFHFDDRVLEARGWRERKGAPYTFDLGGFRATLLRLRDNTEDEIATPVFDRDLEIARAGARIIPRAARHVLVEGNYLLLDVPGWRDLRALFDTTVFVDVTEDERRRRLTARWRHHGLSEAEIERRVEGNDLPNGLEVIRKGSTAEFVLTEREAAG